MKTRYLKACLFFGIAGLLNGCSEEASPEEWVQPVTRSAQALTLESSLDSQGRDFWLAFPQNAFITPEMRLVISGQTSTTGTVEVPGLGFTASFSVTPGQSQSVLLPGGANLTSADGVEAKGIHVTAGAEVSIHGLSSLLANKGGYLGLPTDVLGTEYLVLGFKNSDIINGSQFAVAATQDDTVVTIVPKVKAGTRLPGVPFSVTLQRGQTYQLQSTEAAPADLSGSSITATRPVAVFGSHLCANVPDGNTTYCDYLVEQLPPTSTWGRSFVTVPLATRLRGDTFRFLASKDGTKVSVNGAVVATLDRGQLHQMILTSAAQVTSTEPILVAQYSNGESYDSVASDPFMMLVPSTEQFLSRYTVTTPNYGAASNHLSVVAPQAAVGQITLNGVAIPASAFSAIGASGFSGARVPVGNGTYNLAGPVPFGLHVYSHGTSMGFEGYGYPAGMALAPLSTVASIAVAPKSASGQANTEHCVTATVRDQYNQPIGDVRVDWAVSGANPLEAATPTDASGQAVFCYVGTLGGADTIVATAATLSDAAAMTWVTNLPPVVRCQDVTVGATCGGATVSVNAGSYDPDPGDTISCAQSPEGPYKPGSRKVTLTCTDSAGASASCQATVTVNLEGPATSETEVVLGGDASMQLQCGVDAWVDPGASATDMCGSPLRVLKFNSGDDDEDGVPGGQDPDDHGPGPNTSAEGTYSVQYMAIDARGTTVSALRSVHVKDTLAPTLKLKGDAQVTHTCGSQWADPGVEAKDACYGDVSPTVQVTGQVNGWVAGTYTLRYDVRDSAGNSAAPVTRTVNVINCPW